MYGLCVILKLPASNNRRQSKLADQSFRQMGADLLLGPKGKQTSQLYNKVTQNVAGTHVLVIHTEYCALAHGTVVWSKPIVPAVCALYSAKGSLDRGLHT